jgi:hypothetical protein
MSDQAASPPARLPMAPKAVAALILAIAACEGGLAYGLPGLILGIVSQSICRRARTLFDADPLKYRGEKILRAAEKWSRIGFIQGIILTIVWAVILTGYCVAIFGIISGATAGRFNG